MNIVHVVPHINEEASGPSYSVPRLCQSLAAKGHQVELSCLAARDEIDGVTLDLHRQWPVFGRFAVSTSHARAMRRKAMRVDIVHNHSLWSMVNVAAGWMVPGHRAKLVASPRGTLSNWALGRTRMLKLGLWPMQKQVLTKASLLHATSEAEYREIRSLGLEAPVLVAPNGVDLPGVLDDPGPIEQRSLLFLGRLHPVKGLDRLLQAWQRLQHKHGEWNLLVAGPGEPRHVLQVHELAKSLGLDRIEFLGPLYGREKSEAYSRASLFVLPSRSENFGMSVAEALAHGCPAIVSKGAPWAALESEECGWWVGQDVEELTLALDRAMDLPAGHLLAMGRNGRAWMEREFTWPAVAERLDAAYRWILDGGETPAWVRVS